MAGFRHARVGHFVRRSRCFKRYLRWYFYAIPQPKHEFGDGARSLRPDELPVADSGRLASLSVAGRKGSSLPVCDVDQLRKGQAMIATLTVEERQRAIAVSAFLALCGLVMAIAGRDDLLGAHGVIVLLFGLGGIGLVLSRYFEPEPPEERLTRYYDDPTKVGIVLSLGWAVVGMFFGVWVAALLAWPDLTFDAGWASFGPWVWKTPPWCFARTTRFRCRRT